MTGLGRPGRTQCLVLATKQTNCAPVNVLAEEHAHGPAGKKNGHSLDQPLWAQEVQHSPVVPQEEGVPPEEEAPMSEAAQAVAEAVHSAAAMPMVVEARCRVPGALSTVEVMVAEEAHLAEEVHLVEEAHVLEEAHSAGEARWAVVADVGGGLCRGEEAQGRRCPQQALRPCPAPRRSCTTPPRHQDSSENRRVVAHAVAQIWLMGKLSFTCRCDRHGTVLSAMGYYGVIQQELRGSIHRLEWSSQILHASQRSDIGCTKTANLYTCTNSYLGRGTFCLWSMALQQSLRCESRPHCFSRRACSLACRLLSFLDLESRVRSSSICFIS